MWCVEGSELAGNSKEMAGETFGPERHATHNQREPHSLSLESTPMSLERRQGIRSNTLEIEMKSITISVLLLSEMAQELLHTSVCILNQTHCLGLGCRRPFKIFYSALFITTDILRLLITIFRTQIHL